MRSSSARKRKTLQPHSAGAIDDSKQVLPVHLHDAAADEKKPLTRGRKSRRRAALFRWCLLLRTILLTISMFVLLLIADYGLVYLSVSYFPSSMFAAHPETVPIDNARVAIVSLHEGFKYHGLLGAFLSKNKRSFACTHGYAYVDDFPDEHDLAPLEPAMKINNRANYFKKPRFLLHIMERHKNLEWVLWIDGDAIITQQAIRIEDRIDQFLDLHRRLHKTKQNKKAGKETPSNLYLVWAKDSQPDVGVMLLRNGPTSRAMLRTSLATWEDKEQFRKFPDQASLIATVDRNSTYRESQLVLENGRSTLLQSRVGGPEQWKWQPGHWILYLPNHNYLELLSSLKKVGRRLMVSPAPVFSPIGRPNLESVSPKQRERFYAVQGAIRHAWRGYAGICLHSSDASKRFGSHIPLDDLSPVSGTGQDWLYHAATLHDSLDTLAIAFGPASKEYQDAAAFLLNQDLQATALRPTKTFEYSLRVVGGLLGAFSVTGDAKLLFRAKDAADALLQSPFATSPTVFPRMYDVLFPPRAGSLLYKIYSKIYQWGRDAFTDEHHFNSLAGVGSFALEFYFLSQSLGNDVYRKVADDIFLHISKHQRSDGIVPSYWNVMTGLPSNAGSGLGSGADSFYEYLLKVPLLGCTNHDGAIQCANNSTQLDMLAHYCKVVQGPLRSKHVMRMEFDARTGHGDSAYPVDGSVFHHLLCFVPGMLALGQASNVTGRYADVTVGGSRSEDMALAEELLQGCHNVYERSPTGLGPESVQMAKVDSGGKPGGDRSYLLRPEYVESLFILYRLSGKEEYQDMGWKVFRSIERYCKVENGYVGLKDVYDPGSGIVDDMPSYFIAETLKYLLLLFAPTDYIDLNDFVFTTEAHPLRRPCKISGRTITPYVSMAETSSSAVHAPFPTHLWGAVLVLVAISACIIWMIRVCIGKVSSMKRKHAKKRK